jgi:hypothetical protein
MGTEKTKDKEKKTGCADFGCAPGGFQGMSEIMSKCCAGQTGFTDWSAFMKGMKETCCSPEIDKTEKKTKKS